jgi:hypothetical protein
MKKLYFLKIIVAQKNNFLFGQRKYNIIIKSNSLGGTIGVTRYES